MEEQVEYEIKPVSKFSFGFKELWQHRELLYFFIWRDLKVKYKQTVLGVAWVIFQPLILTLVFTFALGSRFESSLPGINYPLFVLSGFITWNIFSGALTNAGNSMVTNANIIKKIYFPRMIIPVSAVAGAFFDFAIAILIYIGAFLYFGASLDPAQLIFIPLTLLLIFTAAFGTGSMIAALNVKYRDFRYILPFMVQAMMFVSPVFYPLCGTCGWASYLFAVNPMYAPIELFRTHVEGYEIHSELVMISIGVNFALLILGVYIFRKTEYYFADLA